MPTDADFDSLAGQLAGELVTPSDDGWDEARLAWNLAADQRPAAVAKAAGPEDVAAVVAFARASGLGVVPQGTGHGAPGLAPLDDAILVKTDRLTDVAVDGGRARVGAGVIWRDLLGRAQERGMVGLGGSSPDVGVVGYALGGGLGWLGRRYGLCCNSVHAIELVTADGEQRRADAETEPDLFWGLRGGGGQFGVVTAIELDLVPLPEVFAGAVIYSAENAREILHAYREWAIGIPDEITSIARFLHLPPLEFIPEPIRDRPIVTLGACYAGAEAEGGSLIAPLRELGEPIMDTFTTMPASQLATVHMDPEEPVPGIMDSFLLRELTAEVVEAFVDVAGPEASSPLLFAELRQLGGALGVPPQGAGAMGRIDGAFAVNSLGSPMDPAMAPAIEAQLTTVRERLERWSTGGSYLNFTEHRPDPGKLYDAQTVSRLEELKRKWDPAGLVRATYEL